jgi:drug/metabolite transporter (DMT)-like permease
VLGFFTLSGGNGGRLGRAVHPERPHGGGALSFTPLTARTLVYLTLVGALVAFAAFAYSLQHLSMAMVSLYSYINPVIAVILGVIVLGEPFHIRMLVAGAIIVAGIVFVKQRSPGG